MRPLTLRLQKSYQKCEVFAIYKKILSIKKSSIDYIYKKYIFFVPLIVGLAAIDDRSAFV